MIQPAQLFREEIQTKMIKCWYDPVYQYYFDGYNRSVPEISNDSNYSHHFASVNNKGEVIGYISYRYNDATGNCNCFGAISFDRGNPLFAKDLLEVIYNIFFKFGFRRIEFFCYTDNPAIKGYRKFIKRYGGEEIGILHDVQFVNGNWADAAIFEIRKSHLKIAIDRIFSVKMSNGHIVGLMSALEYDIRKMKGEKRYE